MTAKKLILTLALLLSATSATLAQSQRNYGPNAPAHGDSFGQPYSGTLAAHRYGWRRHRSYHHRSYR